MGRGGVGRHGELVVALGPLPCSRGDSAGVEAAAGAEAGPGPGRTELRAQSSRRAHSREALQEPPKGVGEWAHRHGVRVRQAQGRVAPAGSLGLDQQEPLASVITSTFHLFISVMATGNGEMRTFQGAGFHL